MRVPPGEEAIQTVSELGQALSVYCLEIVLHGEDDGEIYRYEADAILFDIDEELRRAEDLRIAEFL